MSRANHDFRALARSLAAVLALALLTPSGSARGADVRADAAGAVMMIGDSHSDYAGNRRGTFGFLGQHLGELMAAQGLTYQLYGASGSVPTWWFDGTAARAATYGYTQTAAQPARRSCGRATCVPKLGALLPLGPEVFVIEQGTNLLGYGDATVISQVQAMVRAVAASRVKYCVWVAAPNARTSVHSQASQDRLFALIRKYAGDACYVYDSRYVPRTDARSQPVLSASGRLIQDVPLPYSPDANNDGEHLGMTAAGKWAEGVAVTIDWILAHGRI